MTTEERENLIKENILDQINALISDTREQTGIEIKQIIIDKNTGRCWGIETN